MNLNLEDILNQVLPLIQDSKKDDAEKLITDKVENPGILQMILSLLGGKQRLDLAALLPALLSMVKPENIKDIQDYVGKLSNSTVTKTKKKTRTTTAKAKPVAKTKSPAKAKPKPAAKSGGKPPAVSKK